MSDKMKIVLVNPRRLTTPNHSLGLLYVAAVLEREGHEVVAIDQSTKVDNHRVVEMILNEHPDLVGFTATTPQIVRGFALAGILREQSKVPILFGGVHTTLLPDEVLAKDYVDYVVIGEGEDTVVELVDALINHKDLEQVKGIGFKVANELHYTPPRPLIEDLDTVPFPARHLLPYKWYFAPPRLRGVWTKSTAILMASRGCPYRCIYCGSHLLFGRKVRRRSVQNVIEELEQLRHDFKIDSVWFADDTFTVSSKWVIEFCQELIKKNWTGFKWGVQARVNTVNREMLLNMKKAGCVQLDFGVESGSEKVWEILKKEITREQVVNAFALTKEVGMQRFASFIIGTPGETKEDIMMTMQLRKQIQPDYTEFFYATPFPGTDLYKMAVAHNQIDLNVPFDQWICSKQGDKPLMCVGFTEEELIHYRSKLHNQAIFRNYWTLIKNPGFVFGAMTIFLKGIRGLPKGIMRFLATGKLDNIFIEVLEDYRERLKENTF